MATVKEMFGKEKVIIGMVHFPPLPSSPLYEDKKGVQFIVERIKTDLESLQNGGIDAVMFCNESDRPYKFKADFATVATMCRAIGEIMYEIRVPFGIDVLWDPFAAIAVAKATGAKFIREIITGTYASDMGLWKTEVGEFYRYRKLLDANDISIFFNISAEFAYNFDRRPLEEIAKSVVFSSLADVILVSGPMTGESPSLDYIKKVKNKIGETPVFANTGVNKENVKEILSIADGVITGTSLKKDGITWNPVDENRVREFMKVVEEAKTR